MTCSLVRGVTNLLAHKLVHPVVGLVILATVVGEAGDDERHVGYYCLEFGVEVL
jgi:hypothetical protein